MIGDSELLKQCGLVVLLKYYDKESKNIYLPNYFLYNYGLEDAEKYHSEFIDEGLLIKLNIYDFLKKKTIPELKIVLKENNLPLSGKKDDLINRLIENDISIENNEYYELSQKGLNFIEENNKWLDFHKNNYNVTIGEFKAFWDNSPNLSSDDIAIEILKNELSETINYKDYTDMRSIFYSLFSIYNRNKNIENAVNASLSILMLDLSGLHNESKNRVDSEWFNTWSHIYVNTYHPEYISIHSEYYNRDNIGKIYKTLGLELGAFDLNTMIYYVELYISDPKTASKEIYNFNKENNMQIQSINKKYQNNTNDDKKRKIRFKDIFSFFKK